MCNLNADYLRCFIIFLIKTNGYINLNATAEEKTKRSSSSAELERFCDRLNQAMNGEGAYAFAKRAGFNESLIRKYLSGASTPLIEKAGELAQALKVDLNWLATGKGEMLLGVEASGVKATETLLAHGESVDDFSLVSLYDVEASAGHGSLVDREDTVCQIAFRKDWIKNKGLQKDKLVAVKVKGDSMYPTLYDGDLILVDTRVEKIVDDSIYLIQDNHNLVVKRVQRTLGGALTIISDNPIYERQHLTPEQAVSLKIIGRVCWYGHEI